MRVNSFEKESVNTTEAEAAQRYLARNETPTPLEPPQEPWHGPTEGS